MSDTEVLHAPSDEVDDVRVSDHYPLGCSGGAGGEKDMCRTLGGVLAGQRRRRRVLQVTVSEGEIESVLLDSRLVLQDLLPVHICRMVVVNANLPFVLRQERADPLAELAIEVLDPGRATAEGEDAGVDRMREGFVDGV